MSSDRISSEVKSSSNLIPGNKSKQFSFLQPLYQDRVETDSVRENKQRANPKQPLITHSFGRMSVRPIQAKLTIGQPNDKYEQEADRVASQVVQQISNPSTPQSTQGQSLQRMEEPEEEELQAKPMISVLQRMPEEEEELQTKPQISATQRSLVSPVYQREAMLGEEELRAKLIQQQSPFSPLIQRLNQPEERKSQTITGLTDIQRAIISPVLQRQEVQEEEEQIQAKSIVQRREAIGGGEASTDLDSAINSARGGGQSLEHRLQESMGQAMGADFSRVRIHTDTQSDQLNQSIQARAFTTGQDLFFRQGEYQPCSQGGQELIAHELTHVVQQNGAAVMRSPNTKHEKEETTNKGGEIGREVGARQNPHTEKGLVEDVKKEGSKWDTVARAKERDYQLQLRIMRKTKIEHYARGYDIEGTSYPVGEKMKAWLDPKDPVRGSATGEMYNDTYGKLMVIFNNKAIVRGHLLNHDLGGHGAAENLYPISSEANNKHSINVEQKVKQALNEADNDKKGVYYEVEVDHTREKEGKAKFKCKAAMLKENIETIDKELKLGNGGVIESDLKNERKKVIPPKEGEGGGKKVKPHKDWDHGNRSADTKEVEEDWKKEIGEGGHITVYSDEGLTKHLVGGQRPNHRDTAQMIMDFYKVADKVDERVNTIYSTWEESLEKGRPVRKMKPKAFGETKKAVKQQLQNGVLSLLGLAYAKGWTLDESNLSQEIKENINHIKLPKPPEAIGKSSNTNEDDHNIATKTLKPLFVELLNKYNKDMKAVKEEGKPPPNSVQKWCKKRAREEDAEGTPAPKKKKGKK